MSDGMTEKYQKHYNEIVTGTLTDTILKNVSFQANIKLANEIIAEQEQTIQELRNNADTSKKELLDNIESLKKELEGVKTNRVNSENAKVATLENTIKGHLTTISSLQANINELNKSKSDYENVKHQVQHLDTYRNELVKERDAHQQTRDNYEQTIEELNQKIEYLQLTPAKRKKIDAAKKVDEPEVEQPIEIFVSSEETDIVKDGGSF